ncbi:MAG: ribonuclease D [Saprospiraceae bacterium]|nr:ribonuclease D [Saprospiraceae bacterium]MCB9326112.1 ribonuclease D [Lewinellaceae bacterium]
MKHNEKDFLLIEKDGALYDFYEKNKEVTWLSFDTEFVGEKRFFTRLCLLQVATSHGNYIIDPLKVEDLHPFHLMLEDPAILKITHAGDNDYRLMNSLYGTIPQNIFDTQIAAGFLGYQYPLSYGKLVEGETGRRLKKGYAVTDWEGRPLGPKQLEYAILDVLPLYDLWQSLNGKLNNINRLHWAKEEFLRWEDPAFYEKDLYAEVLKSNLMNSLDRNGKLFLMRLIMWRAETAERRDHSKEMVLPSKNIGQIVRSVTSGYEGLKNNRHLPDKLVQKYGQIFSKFYSDPATKEEIAVLKMFGKEEQLFPQEEIMIELLHLLVRQKCLDADVSPVLVLAKSALKKMKSDVATRESLSLCQWKIELLGEELVHWLLHPHELEMKVEGGNILIMES